MNSVALSLGSVTISWYSICILLGIIFAGIVINKEAKKHNISNSFVSNLIFWCVIFGIVGARVYYVMFNLDYYTLAPMEIIKVWNGGLAIHGGIIAGIITLVIYCRKYNVNILKMMDIAVPGVILAQAFGRWGNFFNMEAHGSVVTRTFLESLRLPEFIINGMYIEGSYYHPTFLYESLLCFVGFLVFIGFRKLKNTKTGNVTALYFIWYGIIRYFIESLRTDSLMLGNIKVAQLVSIIMVIIGVILFIITRIKSCSYKPEGEIKDGKK